MTPTLTKNLTLSVKNEVDFDTPYCRTVVDFGDSAENSVIADSRFNNIIKDAYTGYLDIGTTITIGSNGGYDYQGVQVLPGNGNSTVTLDAGDSVRTIWYNNSDQAISFSPRISFDDQDRINSGANGIWQNASYTEIAPNTFAVSELTLTEATDVSVININSNNHGNKTLILDRIELVESDNSASDICSYPFVSY